MQSPGAVGPFWLMPKRILCLAVLLIFVSAGAAADLWSLTKATEGTHRFSTLFTAHDVKNHLSSPEGLEKAKEWCRQTGVTKVFVESFRDGYQAERQALANARDVLRAAGLEVSGCVTSTQVGKKSTGWNLIACYTDAKTQERIREIFEYTASMFDEIMIDDFWFTDCACSECDAARQAKVVKIGAKTFPVRGDTFEDYHCELMVRLSQEYVLGAARRINPAAKLIIKYPQWYDRFHERGYEVIRETADFDRIWVGTETRDYEDKRWGGTVQYEAYFIMRWLGGIGGSKCGGGWYDWLGTTEKTYLEQARQTVLAGAKESLLFCYSGLLGTTGPKNIEALRREIPALQRAAAEVQKRRIAGMAAYKPANSHPGKEARVFDFVGMLGVPLDPTHLFPSNAVAGFFSVHALKDPELSAKLASFIDAGRPTIVTDGLAKRLGELPQLKAAHVRILAVKDDPKSLLSLNAAELDHLRQPLLAALKLDFAAPNRVAFYPFADGSWVVENFNDEPADVRVGGETHRIAARDWKLRWK